MLQDINDRLDKYMAPERLEALEFNMERDKEYIMSMHPSYVRDIQRDIDEESDKLEWEGSLMFDEYLDKETLRKIARDIGRGHKPELIVLIEAMLYNEICCRRGRYYRRKTRFN